MRNLFKLLTVIFVFSLFSCAEQAKLVENIPANALAVLKDGKVSLANSEQQVISTLTMEYYPGKIVDFTSVKALEIDGVYYLRMKNEDGLTATVLLVENKDGFLESGNILCESISTITNGGCTPNIDKISCSECWYNDGVNQQVVKGACKKITTAPFKSGTKTDG